MVLGLWAECGELNALEQVLVTGEHAACVHVLKVSFYFNVSRMGNYTDIVFIHRWARRRPWRE